MNYYEHHIGDYAQATAHLTWLEDAAYSRLLRRYYATEKPLPVSVAEVQRLVGARTKWERQAVANVLREFFDLQEDGWHNARADAEIAKYRARCEKARASIAKRWEAQKAEQQAPDAQADASATKVNEESVCELTPSQRTSRHESESRKSLISQDQTDTNVSRSNYSPYTIHHTPRDIGTPPSLVEKGVGGAGEEGNAHRAERATRSTTRRQTATDIQPPSDVEPQVWADWLAVRKAKRAGPVTPTVMAALRREAAKAGITLQEAVQMCCEAGWQGFRAEWFERRRGPSLFAASVVGRPLAQHRNEHKYAAAARAIFDGVFDD